MNFELVLIAAVVFFVVDTHQDNKYTNAIKGYKKHFKMTGIIFIGVCVYIFLKRNPGESRGMMSHLNTMIKYMPISSSAKGMVTPFLGSRPDERVLTSGLAVGAAGQATGRSVSGTKKKYVAAAQNWKCGTCQKQLDAWYEVDHKERLADGGSNHISNLVALCRNCHGQKTTLENL
jgi:hypothetical protein